ncbi:unnamed protein product [Durusdinium trenchii]|uniref:Histone deacetylase domain-containing protein n=2 Tax=Durusdinium trenchii TaxID=1381693 RepID=A0ABP0QSP8_9DINO
MLSFSVFSLYSEVICTLNAMAQKRRQSDVITPDRKRRAQRLQTAAEKRRRQLNQPIAAALSCASWFPRHEAFTESDHPDHPKRLNACLCGITGRGLWLGTLTVADRLATDEELYLAHQRAHVSGLKRAEKAAQPEEEEEDTERNLGSVIWLPRAGHLAKIASADFPRVRGTKSDTFVTATSLEAARASVGGLLELVDECLLRTKVPGFALCRPPGHHAGISSSTGFCLVNNVAIAARYAQRTYPDLINRVMIFDWDVHHGQGTQEIFWKDPNVLVVSAHLFAKGFYPNSGTAEEVGEDEGRGYNINIALPVGYTDECLMRVFDDVLLPAARRFRPDLILVSAGPRHVNTVNSMFWWFSASRHEVGPKVSVRQVLFQNL